MNCNLTDKGRKKGMRCRSWDCQPCLEFGVSKNDLNIIKTHMQNMELQETIKELKNQIDYLSTIRQSQAEMILNQSKTIRNKDEMLENLRQDLSQLKENKRQLKQQLESCQNELSGISGQLKEAVEVIEFYLSKDLSDCIFKSDEDRHRQFLAKYRGEK